MKLLDVCYALLPLKLYSVDPNLYPDHCYKASWTIKLGVPEGESGKQIASFQMANRSYELLSLCVIGEICIQSLASFAVLFCYDVCIHQVPGGKTERQADRYIMYKLYIYIHSPFTCKSAINYIYMLHLLSNRRGTLKPIPLRKKIIHSFLSGVFPQLGAVRCMVT